MGPTSVKVVGAGLAGCEGALQLASRGSDVELSEKKRLGRTPAQTSGRLRELVWSYWMRGAVVVHPLGLLKEELRRAGSLVMAVAEIAKVPAGGALAVDREIFAAMVTERIVAHPRIRVRSTIVDRVPEASKD